MANYKVPQLGAFEWQQPVKDKDLSAPPGGESKGDRYIVKATGSGDWSGKDKNIATYTGVGWDFVVPSEGMEVWVNDEDKYYFYNGTAWGELTALLGSYLKTFTDGDLSSGKLTVTHNLNCTYPTVIIYNDSEKEIEPDEVLYQTANAIEIDLTSYGTISGTWHARVFSGTGERGTQGYQGNQGDQGNQGNQGTQGTQGNQGNQGIAGLTSKSFIIVNPTADADGPVWRAPVAITITAIHVLCMDGTNIVGQMWEYDSNGLNGATIDSSDITGTAGTNVNDDGSLSNPNIAAGNYVGWKTTSVSGTVTKVVITFEYTVD